MFCAGVYIPVLIYMGVVDKFDTAHNKSRPSAYVSPDRKYIKDIVWNILGMAIPLLTQAIIITSTIIMARALTKSQKFRSANAQTDFKLAKIFRSNETKSPGKLAGKERQVVKQVVVISLVYILCNTPKIVFIMAGVIVPEFALGKQLNLIYVTVSNIRMIFEILNSTITLPIYYTFNTKFRQLHGLQHHIC